jgi:Zn-dependent alcohol dehydrogenase
MQIRAVVFHRAHEPVPIEAIEVDKPSGREVLVRTVAERSQL